MCWDEHIFGIKVTFPPYYEMNINQLKFGVPILRRFVIQFKNDSLLFIMYYLIYWIYS
jgi:hypothetical protein